VSPELRDPRHAPERYLDWRLRCLRDAGFEQSAAERIAAEPVWDLHALLELVDRGCPPELAERILAPLEGKAGAR
jgi:hypothetical protein